MAPAFSNLVLVLVLSLRHFTLTLHPGSTDCELERELDRLLPLMRPRAGQGRQPKQH